MRWKVPERALGDDVVVDRARRARGPRAPSAVRAATACLVFGISNTQSSTSTTRSRAAPVGERGSQRLADHLLGGPLAVAAGLRAEGDSATHPVRRADRTLAGAAHALLPERLGAAAGDLGTGLGGLGPGPCRCELGDDDLVHERRVGLVAEPLGVEVDGAEHGTRRRSGAPPARVAGSGRSRLRTEAPGGASTSTRAHDAPLATLRP